MATKAAKSLFRMRVVNLPWTVGDAQLKQYFSQFGYISNAVVIFNRKTGISMHTGLLEVTDKETFNTILSNQNHYLEGSEIYCRIWSE